MIHDFKNGRFVTKNETIELTVIENKLLDELLINKNNIATYEMLIKRTTSAVTSIYSNIYRYDKENLACHIYALRKKLSKYVQIKTKHRKGYYIK